MEKENYYKVGTVVNTHGIRGEVKIAANTDFAAERFAKGATLFVQEKNGMTAVKIATSRVHKGMYLVLFEGVTNINEIEHYKTHDVFVDAQSRGELEDDEYYYDDIIGLEVQSLDGEVIGDITSILELPANDIWTVARPNGKEALIPVINDVVKTVDIDAGVVVIDVLEGLLD
ncbi:MAG TPA: ribosome maturation factor RimM [Lactobacillaceae bacterium]|jgi:16S rRNA processing protein RimM